MPDFKVKLPDGTWYSIDNLYYDASVPRADGAGATYYRGIDLRIKTPGGWSDYIAPVGYSEGYAAGLGSWYGYPYPLEPNGPPLGVHMPVTWSGLVMGDPPWGAVVGQGAPQHHIPLMSWPLLGRSEITQSGMQITSRSLRSDPISGSATVAPVLDEFVWAPSPYSSIRPTMQAHSTVALGANGTPPNTNGPYVENLYQRTFAGPDWFYDPTTVPKFSRHRWVKSFRIYGWGTILTDTTATGTTVDLTGVVFTITIGNVGSWIADCGIIAGLFTGTTNPGFYFVSDPIPWQPVDMDIQVMVVADAPPPPDPWRDYPTVHLLDSNTVTVTIEEVNLQTLPTDGPPDPELPFPPGLVRI